MNRKQRRTAAKLAGVRTNGRQAFRTAGNSNADELLTAGLQHHKAGRLAEAERHYRQILSMDARHADSLHLLGVIARQAGRHDVAVELIGQAIGLRNNVAIYHNNLGNALQDQGKPDEAMVSYRRALMLDPDFAEAHHNLGNALRDLGKLDEAVASYQRALVLKPEYADAHNNLGIALAGQGKLDEAIASYQRALTLNPNHADAHNNLGILLASQGKLDEAIANYRCALTLKPDFAKAHNNLGNALRDQDKPGEALASYQRALTLKPDYAEAYNNLATAFLDEGRPDEAVAACGRALTIRPDFAEAHNSLGNALRDQGKLDAAMASFQRALTLKPSYTEPLHNMSIALRNQGKLDEARQASERAIALEPGIARYYFNLLEINQVTAGDRHLAALEELARRKSLVPKDQVGLHFALAKAYTDLEEHERAFRHLLDGNAQKRQITNYDEAAQLRYFERIRDTFTPELMRNKQGLGILSAVPIFIVGMPRSGSTLVEQILASHPKAFGAGELMDFTRIAASLAGRDGAGVSYPDIVPALSGEELHRVGTDYLNAIGAIAPEAERVTDKMPSNFFFAGLIHLALPNARIIHTRRSPLDTCISCFSYLFAGDQPFSYDLGELGRYYRAYESLMAHWRRVLPQGAMLEVQYEDVVNDLEGQARRLVSYCGLEWDDACLDFHKTQRPVWTASSVQVRQPIYRSSVGRWRPYENLLRPLIDALGPSLSSH